MVNQSKRSMTKADMVSALRSRGVRGRLTSMRKGELYELLEQSTPPGHTSAERRHPPEKIHKSSGHKKRKPSAYNLFIGKWMRENKGKSMRDAAAAWKASQKGSGHSETHSEHHGSGKPQAVPDGDTMPSAAHDGSGYGHVHSEHKVGSDSKSAGSHDDVPPGMHRMPDGSLMADDAHPVQQGMGHGDEEQLGSGLKDWIKSKATEFKDYWTDPDKEDHHEFFLNLAQQAVDSFDGQKHDWASLLPTDDSGAGGLVDGALLALMPGVGEAADADLAADAAGKEATTGARSVFRAGEGALRRDAAEGAGPARTLFAKNASTSTLLRQGGASAVKSYGKAAAKQAGLSSFLCLRLFLKQHTSGSHVCTGRIPCRFEWSTALV